MSEKFRACKEYCFETYICTIYSVGTLTIITITIIIIIIIIIIMYKRL